MKNGGSKPAESWARRIRRVCEVDPLLCRCGERMRVAGFITQAPVLCKIRRRKTAGSGGGRRDGIGTVGRESDIRQHGLPSVIIMDTAESAQGG